VRRYLLTVGAAFAVGFGLGHLYELLAETFDAVDRALAVRNEWDDEANQELLTLVVQSFDSGPLHAQARRSLAGATS